MNDVASLMMPANLPEWLTLANVLLTAMFAGLTFFILRANRAAVGAMREQMADQNRPFVAVTVQVRMGTPVIQLLIRNVGRSPAQNLRLRLDRDFFQFGEQAESRNLAKQSAFSQSIDCLPPMSELLFDLGMGFEIFASGADPTICPHTFEVSAEYEYGKNKYSEKTHVDLQPYMGTSVPRHPVVEELERVRKSIDNLSGVVKQSANAAIKAQSAEEKND
ncbi:MULTISPECIES: hypothetical protein [Pseudomonadota]|jgi:hypothetical protein|uniref:Uncharacterized protein n=1 Tax=Achromobacter pulmonis TaxID=1389932 RepID=A0A2N8KEH8_9BURK|nr:MULTISPECIES: hypothetical protein [Pseudomonadota]TVT71193.1 MAG: hypothetical protein FHK79_07540 [Pseudomonas sp.]EME0887128.1 hypothetical protein [Pseudomonas aeruginosa]KSH46574.1 hypothetical protein AO969_25420 [Pseudomonas aeruginosa]MCK1050218.1 hypothetical protein [Pseudomonas aeruginosa]MCK1083677.1 hypothetical protein [Pseudomonas aeruginosa]